MATTRLTESQIWERILSPRKKGLSVTDAQALLELGFPQKDIDRMNRLAAKARAGNLTPREQQEIETYGRVDCGLSIVQSKVRQALKQHTRSGNPSR